MEVADFERGDVRVISRLAPETSLAHFGPLVCCPVWAVFARPRLASVARSANEHVIFQTEFARSLTAYLVGDSVVYLKKGWDKFATTKRAFCPVAVDELLLESLGEFGSAAVDRATNRSRIAEAVSGNCTAVFRLHAMSFDGDAEIGHVLDGAGRMGLAIEVFQILRRNLAEFQDVIDYGFGALARYGMESSQKILWILRIHARLRASGTNHSIAAASWDHKMLHKLGDR
jgi:hypothetical protein